MGLILFTKEKGKAYDEKGHTFPVFPDRERFALPPASGRLLINSTVRTSTRNRRPDRQFRRELGEDLSFIQGSQTRCRRGCAGNRDTSDTNRGCIASAKNSLSLY